MAATVALSTGHEVLASQPGSPKSEKDGEVAPEAPEEEEEITFEQAKKRAEERAAAALQCSIDNKEACMACSA